MVRVLHLCHDQTLLRQWHPSCFDLVSLLPSMSSASVLELVRKWAGITFQKWHDHPVMGAMIHIPTNGAGLGS